MIEFARQPVKVAHINVRPEHHGDEEVIAVDLKLAFELPSVSLDGLSPSLRTSLFKTPDNPTAWDDMGLALPTSVRNPRLGVLKWSQTWREMHLALHAGETPGDDIRFDGVTFCKVTMRPREGGTVAYTACAQVHPRTDGETAKLVTLLKLKHEIPGTLDASKETDESAAGK
ncbi:hypothetical protein [Paraburkholderia adhaesiva]|uniref:hypothetical protein n=1 Tax=Paraburkholderia adhaesiva TaxID=2883244 RepID=UPI001F467C39|nr:hypothetical protein [Paraburkholderia adhaesiva]